MKSININKVWTMDEFSVWSRSEKLTRMVCAIVSANGYYIFDDSETGDRIKVVK